MILILTRNGGERRDCSHTAPRRSVVRTTLNRGNRHNWTIGQPNKACKAGLLIKARKQSVFLLAGASRPVGPAESAPARAHRARASAPPRSVERARQRASAIPMAGLLGARVGNGDMPACHGFRDDVLKVLHKQGGCR